MKTSKVSILFQRTAFIRRRRRHRRGRRRRCRHRRRMSSFIFRPGVTNANFDIFIQIDLFPDSQQIRGLVIQFQ